VWQVLGSNHRRLSRRFYSPILLFEAYAADLHLCLSRQDLGQPPSAMRPWTPGSGVRAVHRPWRNRPRTGPDRPTDDGGKGARPLALGYSELMAQRVGLGVLLSLLPPRQPQQRQRHGRQSRGSAFDPRADNHPTPLQATRPAKAHQEQSARWHRFSASTSVWWTRLRRLSSVVAVAALWGWAGGRRVAAGGD
jgi:hypothetical protein